MTHLERLVRHAGKRCAVLYIEHNDFKLAGLPINEELLELVDDGELDPKLAETCEANDSLWSIRYYQSGGSFDIVYHSNLEDAAEAMNRVLGLD